MIHDVDNAGVSNAAGKVLSGQKRRTEFSRCGMGFVAALQLRRTIYSTEDDGKRFRQLVVNLVLATDIFDKEPKELRSLLRSRSNRCAKAFRETYSLQDASTVLSSEESNRKATVVIEHIIQASDVAHTMQHWHIYNKWNRRFFNEMYEAYA
jgi:uncharacterized protein (DUF2384 family)